MPKIKPWVIALACFILGLMVSGCVLYLAIIKPGDKLARDYKATNASLTVQYSKLQADYSGLESTNSDLAARIRDRQNVINKAASAVDSLGSGLDASADLIQVIIDEISKLGDILRNG